MSSPQEAVRPVGPPESLLERYARIRSFSQTLCAHLEIEDFVVQSMPDVSPTRWHLAHVTWFFEKFVLEPHLPGYRVYDEQYHYLFNSYYYTAGQMHARPKRGLLTRPTVSQVLVYRAHVDEAVDKLLDQDDSEEIRKLVTLGLNHEQQHQELMLTDIKHVFSCNPLEPAVNPELTAPPTTAVAPLEFVAGDSGICEIGADGNGFAFDNETPRHTALLHAHRIASRLVTNAEYCEFVRDGGYEDSRLWLSDGWAAVNERDWRRPLYWDEELASEFTLGGRRDLNPGAPVTHVSYYEADAYARWADCRLPSEAEWEVSASQADTDGNFVESDYWHPIASEGPQYFGDVWEWTSSAYGAYPGFRPLDGSLGEYNGKFMSNQMTVRGGSCVTSAEHIRASYRSFFYPDARWQFLGVRLAKDGTA
jgi:ergothioneine biosynthesis protein EgtB